MLSHMSVGLSWWRAFLETNTSPLYFSLVFSAACHPLLCPGLEHSCSFGNSHSLGCLQLVLYLYGPNHLVLTFSVPHLIHLFYACILLNTFPPLTAPQGLLVRCSLNILHLKMSVLKCHVDDIFVGSWAASVILKKGPWTSGNRYHTGNYFYLFLSIMAKSNGEAYFTGSSPSLVQLLLDLLCLLFFCSLVCKVSWRKQPQALRQLRKLFSYRSNQTQENLIWSSLFTIEIWVLRQSK